MAFSKISAFEESKLFQSMLLSEIPPGAISFKEESIVEIQCPSNAQGFSICDLLILAILTLTPVLSKELCKLFSINDGKAFFIKIE